MTTTTTKRTIVREWGSRGARRILVIRETVPPRRGEGPERVRWVTERYVGGRPKRKVFADKPSAITWAGSWYRVGLEAALDLSLRQLFDRYLAVVPAQKSWRPKTLVNFQQHRKRIEETLGPHLKANTLGLAHLDELWQRLTAERGMAPSMVRAKVKQLQRVFAWAHAREFVTHNKPAQWTIPEVHEKPVEEFRPAEVDELLRQWDPWHGWEWRPHALTLLMQSHGFRVNAALHLRWDDVDLERGVVILRAEHDKTKKTWERPLTWDGYAALLTARWHRDRLGKDSPWVFFGKAGEPYTYGGYWVALQKAERAAGIRHRRRRAAHGMRRHAVNDVRQRTGSASLALLWVGDTDLRQAESYVRTREDELKAIADGDSR